MYVSYQLHTDFLTCPRYHCTYVWTHVYYILLYVHVNTRTRSLLVCGSALCTRTRNLRVYSSTLYTHANFLRCIVVNARLHADLGPACISHTHVAKDMKQEPSYRCYSIFRDSDRCLITSEFGDSWELTKTSKTIEKMPKNYNILTHILGFWVNYGKNCSLNLKTMEIYILIPRSLCPYDLSLIIHIRFKLKISCPCLLTLLSLRRYISRNMMWYRHMTWWLESFIGIFCVC